MSTVVEFIGLCVLTAQSISPNPNLQAATRNRVALMDSKRVVAIMPKVPDLFVEPRAQSTVALADLRHTASSARADATGHAAGARHPEGVSEATAGPGPHLVSLTGDVAAHTAMLMFRTEDYRSKSGWTDADVRQLDTGWEYVELRNGEQVGFVPDLPNVPLPLNDPIPAPIMSLGERPLLPRYSAPPYAGAAAVFTITSGVLGACARNNGRIDTTLTLATRKALRITAGSKSLTVRDGAVVIAANVPLGYANNANDTGSMSGASHLTVYCAMQGGGGCSVTRHGPPDNTCDSDDGYGRQSRLNPTASVVLPPIVRLVDWSCSNSQWP